MKVPARAKAHSEYRYLRSGNARFHFQHGMILLEVMLATAIFAIAAVSLAVAVDQSIDAFHDIRRSSNVRVHLQSFLAEARGQKLTVGKDDLETEKGSDVTYTREVKRLERNNFKNDPLGNLYEVIIRAEWSENNQKQERTAREYVFQP
ncbi:MAG TPA: hypothetical protein VIT91_05825 [Chthoniobacterales bacterium]